MEYYGTEEGKGKKKQQNGKRSQGETPADHHRRVAVSQGQRERDGVRFDAGIVSYVGMVTSLIEGRRVSEEEILETLVRAMRQHSISRRRKIEYVLSYLKKNARYP
ncbi:MAG: hypothetical protein DMG49_04175 [Acidobacteria bacterium]|nr:MAG: hypothetical protein DMG49_04175 [Acidobacteriota bacterium]